jgi:hypothetical protein
MSDESFLSRLKRARESRGTESDRATPEQSADHGGVNVGRDARDVYAGAYSGAHITVQLPPNVAVPQLPLDDIIDLAQECLAAYRRDMETKLLMHSAEAIPQDSIDAVIAAYTRHWNDRLSDYAASLARHGPDHPFTRKQFANVLAQLADQWAAWVAPPGIASFIEAPMAIFERRYGWILEDNPGTVDEAGNELRAWARQQIEDTKEILNRYDRKYRESPTGQWYKQEAETMRRQWANERALDEDA